MKKLRLNRWGVVVIACLVVAILLITPELEMSQAPALPDTESLWSKWWVQWIQDNLLIIIAVLAVLLVPSLRELAISGVTSALPWAIGILLVYFMVTNENWHNVVYNLVDAGFDSIMEPFLPSNHER
jgi:cytochrome bd-type quinol oxidase subunit 2